MSENTETQLPVHITTLRCLISPRVLAELLTTPPETLAAQFAIVSLQSGVSEAYTRASWRQLQQHISQAIARKSSPRKLTKGLPPPAQQIPLEQAINKGRKKDGGNQNSPG